MTSGHPRPIRVMRIRPGFPPIFKCLRHLVYEVVEDEKAVKILRMLTHYE